MSEIELHRKLLGDAVRNHALHEALKRTIRPGMTVADIGAGTGFLSFLARALGAKSCTLYEYSGALQLARELARKNRITGLSFVQAHSTEVKRPTKADVVISETLGNFALEEHLLETLVDARRFLKPGGTLIPRGLEQYVAPVVRPRIQSELDVWPRIGHDLDFSPAREVGLNNMYVKTLRPEDLPGPRAARRWDALQFGPGPDEDQPSSVRSSGVNWQAQALGAGTVYGFALWWELELVPGVSLSTSPYAPPTHWEQVYLPLLEPVTVQANDELVLQLTSDTRLSTGVRLVWETRVRRGGKALSTQRQDSLRGRL